MFEAVIFNVAVTISGIYLFHRMQFFEEKEIVFSKNYITLLMIFISFLLMTYPIEFKGLAFNMAFMPLLFIGRYTNAVYTFVSAVIAAVLQLAFFHGSWIDGLVFVGIGLFVGVIGPFISMSHFASIQILNGIALVVIVLSLPFRELPHMLLYTAMLICVSFIMTICSGLMFVDIWQISKLIKRYEHEDAVDYLTGLGNVREFDRQLNATSRYEHQAISLLLIDIDEFKEVNDQYGHIAGDAVLRQIAQVLTNYIPVGTKAFRNGGEEFSVILVDVTLDSAIKLAESIRQGVRQTTFHLPNKETISLTVSIGVGYLQKEEMKSHRKIFKDADDMLYAAKEQGHDTVMFNPIIK
ncbi:GGDEF domain-containing protein GdpS [Macrococcus equipercicus]|uniref:Diguanylate cyclase n=1 Tax=Macrococcus equipercicus TaxID=69967 RepID=A0A9Q9BXD0_9STAP|nr:GGDEF domain-containing protein [Macrococcus equipercicus]KAA1042446.1 diguanylate cyclase [Macrococcus equipercicus]UTH14332.1 diguanylate cyclase [Macrococcus equipercicus]